MKQTEYIVKSDDTTSYFSDKELTIRHRDGGPAIENGIARKWFQNGLLHRLDGPAVVTPCGSEEWWQNGKLHRVDGPAWICNGTGIAEWRQFGTLHRDNGPAIEYKSDKEDEWYCNGIRVAAPVVPKESDEPHQNEVTELMSFSEIFDAMRADENLTDEEYENLRAVFSLFTGADPAGDDKEDDAEKFALQDEIDYLTSRVAISKRADELTNQIYDLLTSEEQEFAEMGALSDVLFVVIDPETEIADDVVNVEQTDKPDELAMKVEYLLRRRDLTKKSNKGNAG